MQKNKHLMPTSDLPKVLQNEIQYHELFFYKKAEVVYAVTYHFAGHYLNVRTDRTVDQMVQAARSGKQNIVEGFADGLTSTELQLKLLNVARASFKELRSDYEDYLTTRHLTCWGKHHARYDKMLEFCRSHNDVADYEPHLQHWNDEEICNICLTLLHMIDKMMKTFLEGLDRQFVTQGGIRERMYAARTGYRQGIDAELAELRDTVKSLRQQLAVTQQQCDQLALEKRHLEVLLQQERHKHAP